MAQWEYAHVEYSEGFPGVVTYFYTLTGHRYEGLKKERGVYPIDVMAAQLAKLGLEGWELMSVTTSGSSINSHYPVNSCFYLKREFRGSRE